MIASAPPGAPRWGQLAPYAAAIFLSAFLLFLVQPIIANRILPWFGGAAGVWATCLVFFQSALLAGYAYVDVSIRMPARRQVILHTALLLASLLVLPIIPADTWKPGPADDPAWKILLLLAATIGMPYFLLATTTPLIQAWFWRRFRHAAPYRLFALSNLASLLALVGYPLVFEPLLDLDQAGLAWSGLYVAFAATCIGIGWHSLRGQGSPLPVVDATATGASAPVLAAAAAPSVVTQLQWLALSALGSVMLLAVTNHVTQNVASVPFLWVLPLSLYLVSFILCFDHPRWYHRGLFVPLLAVSLPWMAASIASLDLRVAGPLYFGGLFASCMVCHGELARLKPDPLHLTRFYLMISVGGALGSVLVALVAPVALRGYFELNIALVALAGVLVARGIWLAVARPRAQTAGARAGKAGAIALGLAVLSSTAGFAWKGAMDYSKDARFMARDFYGVVRIRDRTDPVPYRVLYHGGIRHGGQLLDPGCRDCPSNYFGPTSGLGRAMAALNDLKPGPRKVGVVGLGAGVLAAYGRKGDAITFYEISPRIIEAQRTEFTFLRDTPARTEIVLGDGRLSLEREPARGFDLLAIDAFSGDSIPMHLVSREAMAVYVRHLAPGGVMMFQATNRYIDLAPVVQRLAAEQGMHAYIVSDDVEEQGGEGFWLSSTDQILVTRDEAFLKHPRIAGAAVPIPPRDDLPTFTDAHHNLLRILKW